MRNPEFYRSIQDHEKFKRVSNPVSPEDINQHINDAEFLIRKDGIVFNVEGWHHPTEYVVGEALYAPDVTGNKTIFGQKYRKLSLYQGTYTPIPYSDRSVQFRKFDPDLDQSERNPLFARYKQILPSSDFIAHLPAQKALEEALKMKGANHEVFHRDFENLMHLLGINSEEISLGLTGAPLLGNTEEYHDLDIVFTGSLEQNIHIAKTMRDIALHEPDRRLFEGGKAWQIRFFNDFGTLMCTFFTYSNREEAPLRNFTMEPLERDITVNGTVSDDTHSMYTPSVLSLKDAAVSKNSQLIQRYTDIPLIVYHTASRGDCFNGDVVNASGTLVEVTQPGMDSYPAVCVIEREGVRNLTPPWEGYYED